MIARLSRHPVLLSPILALVAQLLLASVAAAATGGGDFPRCR